MRTPSRLMPLPPKAKPSLLIWVVYITIISLSTILMPWYFIAHPLIMTLIAGILIGTNHYGKRRIKILAKSRPTDSICSFARSFDARNIDTRIIRAVYEEVGTFLTSRKELFPLRPADNFWKDLRIDPESLEDIGRDVSYRTGRSFDNTAQNPYFNKVETAADLVNFFMAQPQIR